MVLLPPPVSERDDRDANSMMVNLGFGCASRGGAQIPSPANSDTDSDSEPSWLTNESVDLNVAIIVDSSDSDSDSDSDSVSDSDCDSSPTSKRPSSRSPVPLTVQVDSRPSANVVTARVGDSVTVVVREGQFQSCAPGCVLVSPSNESMSHFVGLAKSIEDAAGSGLIEERRKSIAQQLGGQARVPFGTAIWTGAHNLSKLEVLGVIHVAVPSYYDSDDSGDVDAAPSRSGPRSDPATLLRASVVNVMDLLVASGFDTIAMCGMGCDGFMWPAGLATSAIVAALRQWESRRPSGCIPVRVVLFDSNVDVIRGFSVAVALTRSSPASHLHFLPACNSDGSTASNSWSRLQPPQLPGCSLGKQDVKVAIFSRF